MTRPEAYAAASAARVCILSRKDLRNITRVPRMARALGDAGYDVVVVALRAPVPELREMSSDTQYIAVSARPFTSKLLSFLRARALAHASRRERRSHAYAEAAAHGGWRRQLARAMRCIGWPFTKTGELARRLLLAAPCVAALRRPEQSPSLAWHELSRQPAAAILAEIVGAMHQRAVTRAFAAAADKATRGQIFQIVQAHDNHALLAARRLAARDNARLVYDAVELTAHRLATSFSPLQRLFEARDRRQEAAIFCRADAMTTVGDGVARWYADHYGIPRPVVVRNCRYFWPYHQDDRLRTDIGIGPDLPLIVWFGGIYPQQGVETLIEAMPLLPPSVHLAIIAYVLPRWQHYFASDLPNRAAELGVGDRVHFLPDRSPADLVPYVSGADLGVIPRPSWHPNNYHSMPNKFLEMVMARLPVAVSRLGDIVAAVESYDIGQSFDERDLRDVAAVLAHLLDPEVNRRLKGRVMKAAEEMTWEKESERYLALVRALAVKSADAPPSRLRHRRASRAGLRNRETA